MYSVFVYVCAHSTPIGFWVVIKDNGVPTVLEILKRHPENN